MSEQRTHSWLSKALHRYGIARQVNSTHSGGVGWTAATVQTCLPLRALAMYGSRLWGMEITGRQRVGRLAWCWTLRRRLWS